MSQPFALGSQSTGDLAPVLPKNIQIWFPLGLTGLISLYSKRLSRVFSNTTIRNINSSSLSLLYGPTLTFVPDYQIKGASLVAQIVKNSPATQETQVRSLGWENPLEEGRATHSSILAWEFHGQRSLAGYSPWGLKESDTTEQLTHTHWKRT